MTFGEFWDALDDHLGLSVINELKYLRKENERMREALEAWMKVEGEMADNHPCPDPIMRKEYRRRAVRLTQQVLTATGGERKP